MVQNPSFVRFLYRFVVFSVFFCNSVFTTFSFLFVLFVFFISHFGLCKSKKIWFSSVCYQPLQNLSKTILSVFRFSKYRIFPTEKKRNNDVHSSQRDLHRLVACRNRSFRVSWKSNKPNTKKKKNHFCILLENLVCFLLSISHILKIIKFSRRFPFQPHPPPPTPQNFVVTNIVRSYFFRFILCT